MDLALETSATATLKMQLTSGTSKTQTMPFGMNVVRTVCLYKSYFNIWMEDCESFIRVGKHKHPLTSTHSHVSVVF